MTKPENYLEEVPDNLDFDKSEWLDMSYDMQYYHANENVQDSIREREQKHKDWFNHLKTRTGCRVCEETVPEALVYHHIEEKSFSLNVKKAETSKEKLKSEMDKCVLLCANCHRKEHAGKLGEDLSTFTRGPDYISFSDWDSP